MRVRLFVYAKEREREFQKYMEEKIFKMKYYSALIGIDILKFSISVLLPEYIPDVNNYNADVILQRYI